MTIKSAVTFLSELKRENSYVENRPYQKGASQTKKVMVISPEGVLSLKNKPGFWASLMEWFFGKDPSRDLGTVGKTLEATFVSSGDYSNISTEDLKTAKVALEALKGRASDEQKAGYTKAIEVIESKLKPTPVEGKKKAQVAPKPTTFEEICTPEPQTYKSFFGKLEELCNQGTRKKNKLFEATLKGLNSDASWKVLLDSYKSGTVIPNDYQKAIIDYFKSVEKLSTISPTTLTPSSTFANSPTEHSRTSSMSVDSPGSTTSRSSSTIISPLPSKTPSSISTPDRALTPPLTDSGYNSATTSRTSSMSSSGIPSPQRSPSPTRSIDSGIGIEKESIQELLAKGNLGKQFARLQEILQKLDPGSKSFTKDLKDAIELAHKLMKANPELKPFLKNLEKVLILLSDPKSFDIPKEADLLLSLVATDFNGKYTKDETSIKSHKSMAISAVVKFIKANAAVEKFENIEEGIPSLVKKQKEIILDNLISMLKGSAPSKEVLKRAIKQMQTFAKSNELSLEDAFTLLIEEKNRTTGNRFGEILSKLPFLNPLVDKNLVVDDNVKEFYEDHLLGALKGTFAFPSEDLLPELALQSAVGSIELQAPMLLWIEANYKFIVKSYDQGSDEDRNAGGGTCFNNSVDRIRTLVKNQKTNPSDLEMGSTSEGRFDIAHVEMNNPGAAGQINNYLGKKGLKIVGETKLSQSPAEAVQGIIKLTPSGAPEHVLFYMHSLKGNVAAHAINILIKGNEVWLFDDNFGILKFADLKTARATITSFIQTFYGGEYNAFYGNKIATA